MQLLNANGYRSIFEATGHKLRETGGVMLWKLNAAFPSVVWQVYDWFLEPNAGYYFMQRACEPLHIQLNLDDSSVALVNRTYQFRKGLNYTATIMDLDGRTLFKQEGRASIDTTDAKSLLSLAEALRKTKGISFVLLTLHDATGKTISRNTYWMSPEHDFNTLRQMPAARVQVQATASPGNKTYSTWTVRFKNTSDKLAFFLNPQVITDGEEVLPSYWSDNYFSVPPGGTITATVSCPTTMLKGAPPELRLEGWNIPPDHIPLTR
jgi:exo-1,4-beta-D-glucosaminidase